MATRMYLEYADDTHMGTSVQADAGWEIVQGTTGKLRTLKSSQALAQYGATHSISGVADMLCYRGLSDPLDVDQTITGTFVGVSRFAESNSAADARVQCQVKVVKPDGTFRGTLIGFDNGALANEFSGTTNRIFPRGGPAAVSSVAALAGDRLFLEVGVRMHYTGASAYVASMYLGSASATDSTLDEVGTAANNPWIEFSQNLTFKTIGYLGRISTDVVTQMSGQGRVGRVSADVITKMQGQGRLGALFMDILVPNGNPLAPTFQWGVPNNVIPRVSGKSVWIPDNSEFVAWPLHTAVGDRMIIQAENGWNVDTPSGFTQHYFLSAGNGSGGLYSKIMDATDISNGGVTLTATGGSFPGAATFVRVSGIYGAPSVRAFAGVYAGSALGTFNLNSPVPVVNELLLWMVCARGDVDISFNRGTQIAAVAHGSGGAASGAWYEIAQSTSVLTGTFVAGGATSNRIPQCVAVTLP